MTGRWWIGFSVVPPGLQEEVAVERALPRPGKAGLLSIAPPGHGLIEPREGRQKVAGRFNAR